MDYTPMIPYGTAIFLLIAALAYLIRQGEHAAIAPLRTMAVIGASWLAWCGWITMTGDYIPWQFGILLDTVAAAWLLRRPSSCPKAAIAALFCSQVVAHIGFGLNEMLLERANVNFYLVTLDWMLRVQLFIMGVWTGGTGWPYLRHLWRGVPASRRSSHSQHHGRCR